MIKVSILEISCGIDIYCCALMVLMIVFASSDNFGGLKLCIFSTNCDVLYF